MTGVFELLKSGIGPSFSHTMGPMKTANAFATTVATLEILAGVDWVRDDLFRSLAMPYGHMWNGRKPTS